ncbi:MAG: ABC transporter permease subunit [Acetobacterium sp.]
MNILAQELKMEWKSLVIWCLSLIGGLLLFMLLYPLIASQLADFQKIFDSFPIEFRRALGVANLELGGVLSYYTFTLTYILLAGAVQAMNLGVSVLSAEVRDKTGDFLFVKPVSRSRVISMKMLSVLVQILITNAVFFLVSWITLNMVSTKSFDPKLFGLLTGTLFFIQIFFASFGFFISVFLRRIKTVLPISMGVVFLFYIIFLLNQTLKDLKLSYISPFGYFDLSKISMNLSYDLPYVLLWSIFVALFVYLTFELFVKKDLPSI